MPKNFDSALTPGDPGSDLPVSSCSQWQPSVHPRWPFSETLHTWSKARNKKQQMNYFLGILFNQLIIVCFATTCQTLTLDGQSRALKTRIISYFTLNKTSKLPLILFFRRWIRIHKFLNFPKSWRYTNKSYFLRPNLKYYCFSRGFEQLSSSIGRKVMTGRSPRLSDLEGVKTRFLFMYSPQTCGPCHKG